MTQTVVIEDLQVGMFVHLDLGWWAHPFALSSFLITCPEQIVTIRRLGLRQLRWSPEKSRLATPSTETGDAIGDAGAPAPATDTSASAADDGRADAAADLAARAAEPLDPLAAQQAAQRLCEQQYAEAGRAWHDAQHLVQTDPPQALAVTESLTRALLDKLMVDREMCVRVISDVGTDRQSGHALNVAVISMLMGRVFGFSASEMLDLGVGALLHDVGKLELPELVRHGELCLSPREHQAYREHVPLGVAIGQRMGLSEGALAVLAQHHEMADGSGFPAWLNLDRMAIGARVVALVNRYDKLCNPAQVASAMTPHEALSTMFAQSRTRFDATMLNAFIRMMGVYPPGSLVQLTDDRYATVVSCNSSRPLKPRVLVCDTQVPVDDALLLNLDGQADVGIRRSLKATQLPAAARDYLSPRQRMVYFFEPVLADLGAVEQALAA
jgi:putative nucleotidyltransferase with HDIG domain